MYNQLLISLQIEEKGILLCYYLHCIISESHLGGTGTKFEPKLV